MQQRIFIIFIVLLVVSSTSKAQNINIPLISFEQDSLSLSGARGCFPNRKLYDLSGNTNFIYSAYDEKGKKYTLTTNYNDNHNTIMCPSIKDYNGKIEIFVSLATMPSKTILSKTILYREVPFPQIKSLIRKGKDFKIVLGDNTGVSVSSFEILNKTEARRLTNTNSDYLFTMSSYREQDGPLIIRHTSIFDFEKIYIEPFIQGNTVGIQLSNEYETLTEFYINDQFFPFYSPVVQIDNIHDNSIVTLHKDGVVISELVYTENNTEISTLSYAETLCGKCSEDNKKDIITLIEIDNSSINATQPEDKIIPIIKSVSVLDKLNSFNENMLTPQLTKDEYFFSQNGIRMIDLGQGNVQIINDTSMPISAGLLADYREPCVEYIKHHSSIGLVPSLDLLERSLQQATNLNSVIFNVSNEYQQIEIITPGESKSVYPQISVDEYVEEQRDNGYSCNALEVSRRKLDSQGAVNHLASIANQIMAIAVKLNYPRFGKNPKKINDDIEIAGHLLTYISNTLIDGTGFSTNPNSPATLNDLFNDMSNQMSTFSTVACRDKSYCKLILKQTGTILDNLNITLNSDELNPDPLVDVITIGLTANAINEIANATTSSLNTNLVYQGATIAINSYQSIKDNFLLDELIFKAAPNREVVLKHVGAGNFDVSKSNSFTLYGKNLNKAYVVIEQNGTEYNTNIRPVKFSFDNKLSLPDAYYVGIGYNNFRSDMPVNLLVYDTTGVVKYSKSINTFDGSLIPFIADLSPHGSGLFIKKNRSFDFETQPLNSFEFKLSRNGSTVFETRPIAVSKITSRYNKDSYFNHLKYFNNILPDGPSVYDNNDESYLMPGNYELHYRYAESDEWLRYPKVLVIPGGKVNLDICKEGVAAATINPLFASVASVSYYAGVRDLNEFYSGLTSSANMECESYKNIPVWNGLRYSMYGKFDISSYVSYSEVDPDTFTVVDFIYNFVDEYGNSVYQMPPITITNRQSTIRIRGKNNHPYRDIW